MNETIEQRINDLNGFCSANKIRIKDVAIEAGFKPHNIWNQLRVYSISNDRLDKLEAAAIRLREKDPRPTNKKISRYSEA